MPSDTPSKRLKIEDATVACPAPVTQAEPDFSFPQAQQDSLMANANKDAEMTEKAAEQDDSHIQAEASTEIKA